MESSIKKTSNKIKIMFLCWGFSIHAKRRIEIFKDDNLFDVCIVSTHNYNFGNSTNYLLTDAKIQKIENDRKSTHENKKNIQLSYLLLLLNKIVKYANIKKLFIGIKLLCNSQIVKQSFKVEKKILLNCIKSQRFRREIIKSVDDLYIFEKAIDEFRPQVIFLQTLLYPCYLNLLSKNKLPFIVTFWNGDLQWKAKWNTIDGLIKKNIVSCGINDACQITVNTKRALDICIKYGASKNKVNLIRYPGVDLKIFFPASSEKARKALNIKTDKVVLWPRGLGQYLNSEILVLCAPLVLDKYPSTTFIVLIGNDNIKELDKHKRLSNKLGVSNSFRWESRVDWNTMPLFYNAADVTISISSKDSFPNCMIESMACKTPVIMGDLPSIKEWLEDNKNGFLVKLNDPDALAEEIISLFSMDGDKLKSICEEAYAKTLDKANYEINKNRIKKIVKKMVDTN